MTPVVQPQLRPGSPLYGERMDRHRAAIAAWGVPLPAPSPDLVERAQEWGRHVHRVRSFAGASTIDPFGGNHIRHNAEGQIGAELFANHFGTCADWTVYPESDPGWDVVIPARHPVKVDVKTRKGWMTLRTGEIRMEPDYYALVDYTNGTYIFSGVIAPGNFHSEKFPLWIHEPMWAVTAEALLKPAHFHPFDR